MELITASAEGDFETVRVLLARIVSTGNDIECRDEVM
jgi:hypothetical protein